MYPHERSLVEEMKDEPFVIIGVNSDNEEQYRKAIEREDITWRSFYDGGSTGGPIATFWGVSGWPTTCWLDHEGGIRFKNVRGKGVDNALVELLPKVPGRTLKVDAGDVVSSAESVAKENSAEPAVANAGEDVDVPADRDAP
ncbi:MAG: redoxin domain-containing protein [Fuerstiella sp.]|nr:redoxin domain-containing protein [Fuerstiella sp.]MCP4855042.1 redoxin domain-containing protein [Fuerstiella sp.]